MIDEICGPLGYDPIDPIALARTTRWLNASCLQMAEKYDFPNLVHRNGSFTTIAGEVQDLTATAPAGLGGTFLRVLQDTIRIGQDTIPYKYKSYFDEIDPDRTYGGNASFFSAVGDGKIILWPAPGSGVVVSLDWMAKPATITAATTEANMPFDTEFHETMVNGARVRGMRYAGTGLWYNEQQIWFDELKRVYANAHGMKLFYSQINARDLGT